MVLVNKVGGDESPAQQNCLRILSFYCLKMVATKKDVKQKTTRRCGKRKKKLGGGKKAKLDQTQH